MLLIIDLQHIYYRCWFTRDKREPIYSQSGRDINHVKATFDECIKIIKDFEFHYDEMEAAICVCLDTNRDGLVKRAKFPEYKANRGQTLDDENRAEIIYVANALGRMGANVYGAVGYEADDLVYTLVKDYAGEKKVIYTSDADLLMHVNENTEVWIRQAPEYARITAKRYAHQMSFIRKNRTEAIFNDTVLYKSCVGDSSDNIKGVYRFGNKAFDKKISVLLEANPDIVVPATKDGTLEFAKTHFGFNDTQMEQFLRALDMVFPYYCKGIPEPKVCDLTPFLKMPA